MGVCVTTRLQPVTGISIYLEAYASPNLGTSASVCGLPENCDRDAM